MPHASRNLLGLADLSVAEITGLLDAGEHCIGVGRDKPKRPDLAGKTVVNLFFEPSTRTRMSFGLAARRLGGDVLDFAATGSSVAKGESLLDTAKTIEAMGVDVLVVRHSSAGVPHLLTRHLSAAVINAGDGGHEHPTQGLLDLLTIRQIKGTIAGLTVALVGDIRHSRVARSNIHGLTKLGAMVIACGPPTLVPEEFTALGVEVCHRLDDVLPRCDVLNLLRLQHERQNPGLLPSLGEYARLFGMDGERMKRAKPDVLLLAPGPINRGVEITADVADGPNSAILRQVTNGLAVRMAVLARACRE